MTKKIYNIRTKKFYPENELVQVDLNKLQKQYPGSSISLINLDWVIISDTNEPNDIVEAKIKGSLKKVEL